MLGFGFDLNKYIFPNVCIMFAIDLKMEAARHEKIPQVNASVKVLN